MLASLIEHKDKKYDVLTFLPKVTKELEGFDINAYCIDDIGEAIIESQMGYPTYHICTFCMDKDYKIINMEKFEGVLLEPLEYMSRLISQKTFGIIVKKCKNSITFFENAVKIFEE